MAYQTLADNIQTKAVIEELKYILFQPHFWYGKLIVEANLRDSCPLYLITTIH